MTGMFIVSHIHTQYSNAYIYCFNRNNNRQAEIKELTAKGIIPHDEELKKHPEKSLQGRTFLIGRVAALIDEVLPAKVIVDTMVKEAVEVLQGNASLVKVSAKL